MPQARLQLVGFQRDKGEAAHAQAVQRIPPLGFGDAALGLQKP
jgi:hypothetical protein